VSVGLVLAFACDSKRTADDDDGSAGEGGESAAKGGKSGSAGAAGRGAGARGGSAGRAGDGPGESGAPSNGGATGGESASGGSGGDGVGAGEGGDNAAGGAGVGGSAGGNGGAGGSLAGNGGSAGSGGSAGDGFSGAAGAGACGNMIDDMESGTGYTCEGNGRRGSWFSYVSTYGVFNPPGNPVPTTLLAVPRGESTRAMRAYGTNDAYAGFGCWLQETPLTYDASAYTGIRFYAMGTPAMLHVIVQTSGTESTTYGGTCTLPTLECAGNETTITIDSTWGLVQVPFSALTGGTVPFDATDLWSIEFQPATTGAFDFYIDDLSFY
jgi:hypothetical protein